MFNRGKKSWPTGYCLCFSGFKNPSVLDYRELLKAPKPWLTGLQ
jgi:hypothetical protein